MKPKNIIPGLLIAITVFFFSRGCGPEIADDTDYKNFAEDYCTCFNKSTASISEEAKQIIINSDPSNPEKMIIDLIGKISYEDLEKIENTEACMDEMEKKYGDLKTRDSEEEVIGKMLDAMDQNEKCEFTSAIMRIGLEAQNNPDFN